MRYLISIMMCVLLCACFTDDRPPPCSPDGDVAGPGGPVHGPADPGPILPSPYPDGAEPDERLGETADGETCTCGPYELGCGTSGGGEGSDSGQIPATPPSPARPGPSFCGDTWECIVDYQTVDYELVIGLKIPLFCAPDLASAQAHAAAATMAAKSLRARTVVRVDCAVY